MVEENSELAYGRRLTATAHSKVNLHLGVGPLRHDGYHELVTIFQSLSLKDELECTELRGTATDQAPGIVAELDAGGTEGVPTDASNLAWKAANMVYAFHRSGGGPPLNKVRMHLKKGIPAAGGMAGGSADAAAALRLMQEYVTVKPTDKQLLAMASALGSDVPFTLLGGTRLGTGRGENLVHVMSRGQYHWALAFSAQGLSTPAVFAKLDQMQRTPHLSVDDLTAALISGDPHHVAEHLHNDMQPAALSLQPGLRKTLEIGKASGALAGIVSGSGPTCAFLCPDAQSAEDVAAELRLVGASATATGPALGATMSTTTSP